MNLFGKEDSVISFTGPIKMGIQPIIFQGQEIEGYDQKANKGNLNLVQDQAIHMVQLIITLIVFTWLF